MSSYDPNFKDPFNFKYFIAFMLVLIGLPLLPGVLGVLNVLG